MLFREGRALYEAGKLKAACAKFAASYELDAGLGALLNLARCYKQDGRTASAWGAYTELSGLAQRAGQPDRVTIADEEAAALEPRLMRVKLGVAAPGVELRLDGELWPAAAWDTARPLDPGTHRLRARHEGEVYWERRIVLGEPGTTLVVEVPGPPEAPRVPEVPPAPAPREPVEAPEPRAVAPDWPWWLAGGGTGGLGLVGMGIAAGFTADASAAWRDAGCERGLCPDAESQALSERAGRSADWATGFAVGGGLLATVGVALIVVGLWPDESDVEVGRQGLRIRF